MSICHATDCFARSKKGHFMCRPHWFAASREARSRFNAACRRCNRQEISYVRDREFLEATADLIDQVAVAEGKPAGSLWREMLGRLLAGEAPVTAQIRERLEEIEGEAA